MSLRVWVIFLTFLSTSYLYAENTGAEVSQAGDKTPVLAMASTPDPNQPKEESGLKKFMHLFKKKSTTAEESSEPLIEKNQKSQDNIVFPNLKTINTLQKSPSKKPAQMETITPSSGVGTTQPLMPQQNMIQPSDFTVVKPTPPVIEPNVNQQAETLKIPSTTLQQNMPQNKPLDTGLPPSIQGGAPVSNPNQGVIPITTRSSDTLPSDALPSGIAKSAGFSSYDYLVKLKDCQPSAIDAGVDSASIKGFVNSRCHVIFSIAGREVNCYFTPSQVKQMTTPAKLERAKAFDKGVDVMVSALGTDDPNSPLSTCQQ